MTPLRPSRNSFHNILQKVSTAPVGTPSERVKLRPRLCAALNMAKYARKMNDDPSIRKTWSPFFSLRGAAAVDMGPTYVCVALAIPPRARCGKPAWMGSTTDDVEATLVVALLADAKDGLRWP